MTPTFFAAPDEFRAWLEDNHATAPELWVGFHKTGSGRPSIAWPESVDQALCFGWIDGVRKRIDEHSYVIRFTPRRPGSVWSAKNTQRVQELIAAGQMRPAGLAAFERRSEARSGVYSFEQGESVALGDEFERQFRADEPAWVFFQAQPASYRRAAIWWVVSAKKEETRRRRLENLIADSAAGRTLPQFTRPGRRTAG